VVASGTLFNSISRGWVFRVKLSDEDIAEIEGLRHVATANDMVISYKGWLVFSQPC